METLINNRYIVLREIGKGAMGTVYLVEDSGRGRQQIALKSIRKEKLDPAVLSNFKHEFDIMTRLKHPHLARVYDFGFDSSTHNRIDGGNYYITMEYIDGITLRDLLKNTETISEDKKIYLFISLCRAVDFIHSRGILHRDLKPANIMVAHQNGQQIKVLDFGLSDLGVVDQYKIKGTVPFLAPETISSDSLDTSLLKISDLSSTTFDFTSSPIDRSLDVRVDIYALGMTGYCLLTGKTFFDEDSLPDILAALTDERAFNTHALKAIEEIQIPELRAVIRKMVAYLPQNRYQSLTDVIFDVNKFLDLHFSLETDQTRLAYLRGASFIGRNKEKKLLINSLFEHNNRTKIIVAKGETGVGKSRLFNEFKKYCQLNRLFFIQGNCSKQAATYSPFIEVINEVLFMASASSIDRHGPVLKKILPEHVRLKNYKPVPVLDPRSERNQIVTNMADFIVAVGHDLKTKLVLYVNDLHWADEGSLAVFKELAFSIISSSKLYSYINIYASVRTEEVHKIEQLMNSLKQKKCVEEFLLYPFDSSDVGHYIEATFGEDRIADSFKKGIPVLRDKVGGNPFFLQELIQSLVEQQIIIRDSHQWRLTKELQDIVVPNNLKEIIAARIDTLHLTHLERQWLDVLSLLNQSITQAKMEAIVLPDLWKSEENDKKKDDLLKMKEFLFKLEEMEILIMDDLKENNSFRFIHDLLREVLEEQVSDKINKHDLIGRQLERLYKNIGQDPLNLEAVEELAYHYRLGQNKEKALYYIEKAADNAKKNFAVHKAILFFNQLLEIVEKGEKSGLVIDILLKTGDIYGLIGEWGKGEHVYQQAITTASKTSDAVRLASAYYEWGHFYYLKNDYNKAMDCLKKAEKQFKALGDQSGLAKTIREIGNIHWRKAEFEQAMVCAEKSIDFSTQMNNKKELAYAVKLKGDIFTHTQEYENALDCLHRFLEMCEEQDDKLGMSSATNNMGVVNLFLGNLDSAMNFYQEAIKLYLELGNKQGESIVYCNIADVFRGKGEYKQALEYINRAILLGRELDITHHLSSYLIDKARLLYHIGHYDEAQKHNDEGLAKAVGIGRKEYVILGKLYKIKISLAIDQSGEPTVLSDSINQLFTLFDEAGITEDKASIMYELWKLTNDEKHRKEAIYLYQQAYKISPKNEIQKRLRELQ